MAYKKELCVVVFKKVMKAPDEANRLKETECDEIRHQYSQLIDSEVATSQSIFIAYDAGNRKLDSFFFVID